MTDDLTAQVLAALEERLLPIYGKNRYDDTIECKVSDLAPRIAAALLTVAEALTPSGAPQDMRAQDQAIAAGIAALRGTEEP